MSEMKKMSVLCDGVSKSEGMRRSYNEGYSIKEISLFYGCRYNFVYNVISNDMLKNGKELSLSSGKVSKKEKVIEMLRAGKSKKDICLELCMIYNEVWRIESDMKKLDSRNITE